jgi:hypothetical protein
VPNDFAIDICRIRDEAREHLQQGAVSPAHASHVERPLRSLSHRSMSKYPRLRGPARAGQSAPLARAGS